MSFLRAAVRMASLSELENRIKELKLNGNTHFQSKNYVRAVELYSEGIDHPVYRSMSKFPANEFRDLLDLRQSLLLNRARSHFQQNQHQKALMDTAQCINVLEDTKLWYKAHFVRAEIYKSKGDHRNALKMCDVVLQVMFPSHSENACYLIRSVHFPLIFPLKFVLKNGLETVSKRIESIPGVFPYCSENS